MKRKSGFTLIELLAVIIILALIMIIAVPTIMNVTQSSKKEALYLYVENIYSKVVSKYTQDLDFNKENINCVVYNIKTDLGLSDTGNYEGFVLVRRTPTNKGKKLANVKYNIDEINANTGLNITQFQGMKYCITKENECTPNKTYYFSEDKKEVIISEAIKSDETMCSSYQYEEGGLLKASTPVCIRYNDTLSDSNGDYEYNVSITIKDDNYAVENYRLNEEISMQDFYHAIDEYNDSHPDKSNGLAIIKPSCNGSSHEVVGTTSSVGTSKVTSSTSSQTNTTKATTTTTTTKNSPITTTTTTTTTKTTTTTTEIVVDDSKKALLLKDLYVKDYNLKFSPTSYEYRLNVANSVTYIEVVATPYLSTTTVRLFNDSNFVVGTNNVRIELTDTLTGRTANYYIKVRRLAPSASIPTTTTTKTTTKKVEDNKPDPNISESDATLKTLSVSGYALGFYPTKYAYELTTKGEKELSLTYEANNRNAIVKVSGNKNLKDGSKILVYVQSENGYYSKTYTITVHFSDSAVKTTQIYQIITAVLVGILLVLLLIIAIKKKIKSKVELDSSEKSGNNSVVKQ